MSYSRSDLYTYAMLYLSYFMSYLSRKNILYTAPYLIRDGIFSKAQLGSSQSLFSITYAISKLSANILTDWLDPVTMLTCGLFTTGGVNLLAGVMGSPDYLPYLWSLNGLSCGLCWPPITKILVTKVPVQNRGKLWSIISSSMNTASVLCPLIIARCVNVSWNLAFLLPGIAIVLLGILIYATISTEKERVPEEKNVKRDDKPSTSTSVPFNYREVLNSTVLLLSSAYCLHTFAVIAMATWGQLYYVNKYHVNIEDTGTLLMAFELGGFIGSTVSGFLSDYITKNMTGVVECSPRALVSFGNAVTAWVACSVAVYLDSMTLDHGLAFGFGFGCFGAISMYGLMGRELVPAQYGGSVSAVICLASQVGGFFAGVPLSYLPDNGQVLGVLALAGIGNVGILAVMCFVQRVKTKVE